MHLGAAFQLVNLEHTRQQAQRESDDAACVALATSSDILAYGSTTLISSCCFFVAASLHGKPPSQAALRSNAP